MQASSEILIGWIQLAVVCTFAMLYALSPKPYANAPDLTLEPWVLSAYVVFTLVRLALAHRNKLPNWLLYVSTVLDMALLMVLIFSIHKKYEQPASFYLKVPTLLYVFIFIALRALRYEVRYVVAAGATAAGLWLLMVVYAISVDPDDPMITRDYVEYMTSNSVLLGAEFDKMISIAVVTAILALSIARARRLLERSIAEGAAAEVLSRFVPHAVAEQFTQAETEAEAGQGEVREATILFADLEGFTALSEQVRPTELIAVLNEYFALAAEPITHAGGVINQFQGDAILATFNLPTANPQHAANAVQAALQIQRRLSEHRFGRALGLGEGEGLSLRCRIGINTGTVVGGLVGAGGQLGYTVHGAEANIASRLEQLNKQHGTRICVSERTRELALPRGFDFETVGDLSVRGLEHTVSAYTVLDSGLNNGLDHTSTAGL